MHTLIINIKELFQVRETYIAKVSGAAMADLPSIKNAFLLIENIRCYENAVCCRKYIVNYVK